MSAKIVENEYKQVVSVSAIYFIDCVRELNRYVNDNQTISDAQLPLLIAGIFLAKPCDLVLDCCFRNTAGGSTVQNGL